MQEKSENKWLDQVMLEGLLQGKNISMYIPRIVLYYNKFPTLQNVTLLFKYSGLQ